MKVSINWLKEYIKTDATAEDIADMLTDLGLEVEGTEQLGANKNDWNGVVVGEIVECIKHPDADKLSLTKVNIGTGILLQIVCGAPNVALGQKVFLATVGTTLYTQSGEVIKLKAGKIRGQVSEGMICAEDELGIGTDHSGIIVLPNDTKIGTPAANIFNGKWKMENGKSSETDLQNDKPFAIYHLPFTIDKDTVLEIGLTPNRSDAMCHVGVAQDVAARLRARGENISVQKPDVSAFKTENHDLKINVRVEDAQGCPRYSGVCIKGVAISESPEWLKKRLSAIGVNSINNVVDITNFILHELGQPLHAFDYDKIVGQTIIVKTLPTGTKFTSLKKNETGAYVSFALDAQDLMICDADSNGMCIAGVIGNPHEGVSVTTKNIFLESAYFDAKRLRVTSFRHNTRTDAAKTFEKGTDPNNTLYALKRAALLIKELAGGTIASEIIDVYAHPIAPKQVELAYANAQQLIGEKLEQAYIKDILAALSMDIVSENSTGVVVSVPTNKPDVLRDVDVIEEILRVHGYNNVPMPKHIKMAVTHQQGISPSHIQNLIADHLAAKGFNEAMGLSLSQSKFFSDVKHWTSDVGNANIPTSTIQRPISEELVYIDNTSNVHLDIMRPTMLSSALEMVAYNKNRQMSDLHLFEFGKTYRTVVSGQESMVSVQQLAVSSNQNKQPATDDQPPTTENKHLVITMTGRRTPESWLEKEQPVNFFTIKAEVNSILQRLGIHNFQETVLNDGQWSFGLRYHRGQQVLVEFGKINPTILKNFDVKGDVFFADFEWDTILKMLKNNSVSYKAISKFPSVRRDLALVVDKTVSFNDILQAARGVNKGKDAMQHVSTSINLFDVFEDETKLGVGKKSYAVSFIFEDAQKMLSEDAISKMMQNLTTALETKVKANIRA